MRQRHRSTATAAAALPSTGTGYGHDKGLPGLKYTRCELVDDFGARPVDSTSLKHLAERLGSDCVDSTAERAAVGRVIDALKQAASELRQGGSIGWDVDRVVQSGSYGRKTGIVGEHDYDVVLLVNRKAGQSVRQLLSGAANDMQLLLARAQAKVPHVWLESSSSTARNWQGLGVAYQGMDGSWRQTSMDVLVAPNLVADLLAAQASSDDVLQRVQMRRTWRAQGRLRRQAADQLAGMLNCGTAEAAVAYMASQPGEAKEAARLVKAFVKHRLAVSNWHGGKIASLSYLLELTAVKARNRICFARSSCPRTASIDMEETLRETLSMLSDMDALWVCFSRYYSRRQLPGWQDLPAVMDPTNMHSNAALPLHDSSAARGAIEGIARGGLAVLNASGATIDDLFNA